MDRAQVGDVELCYERMGEVGCPTVLLVAGHGAQLQWWDDEFCGLLVGEGFEVLRYDNRDVGGSTSFESAPRPDIGTIFRGEPGALAYTLWDMAEDAAGLLDTLGVPDAHVVGVSMGGMIAQALAIRHPERVRSLCSMLSTTGAPGVAVPDPSAIEALMELGLDIADPVEREVATARRFASPGFALDEDRVRARMRRHVARGEPVGASERQLAAVLASDDRTAMLGSLTVPTLVIHGDADPLVPPDGGAATAAAVPGARLMVIAGLAHELPPQTWPEVVAAIVALAREADARRGRRDPPAG